MARDADGHHILGRAQIAEDSVQRQHDLRQHDERRWELHAVHGETFEEAHRIDGTGKAGKRKLIKELAYLLSQFWRRFIVARSIGITKGFNRAGDRDSIAQHHKTE